jgi:hypothetical protein
MNRELFQMGHMVAPLLLCACGSSSDSFVTDGGGSNGEAAVEGEAAAVEASPEDGPDALNSSDAGFPPIDRNTEISTLDNAQLGELCDWSVTQFGGYGAMASCTNSMRSQPANQAVCIAQEFMYRCAVTVGQFEDCVLAQAPSKGCVVGQSQCSFQYC